MRGVVLALALLAGRPVGAAPHPAATQRRIDSLRALVAARPQIDSLHIVLLTKLGDAIVVQDARAAGPTRRLAVRLAQQVSHGDLLAETLLDLADYHIALAEYGPAQPWLSRSQAEFTRLHDLGGQMRCLERRGRMADQQGRYAGALSYFFRAMAISSTGDQRRFHTSLQIEVASIYSRLGEYLLARAHLLAALQVARHYDYPDRLNLIYGELGELSRRQRFWDEARGYYAQSRAVSQRLGDAPDELRMDLNLAEMSEQLGDSAAAQAAGYGLLHRAAAAHQPLLQARAQALLARASLHAGHPDSATWYGTQSLRLSQQSRSLEGARTASAVLAVAYARQQDFAHAYQTQQRFAAYDDSLGGAALARRTTALELNYERRQQHAQLKLLGQQQELERLRQQQRLTLLAGLGLLLGLSGGGLFWRYRRRQQRRETAIRTRLAADLHDDVGSLLSQISLQSSLLQEGLADGPGQRRQLGQISEASRSAVRQLNDVVWSLDAHNDHLPDLLDRMRDYAYDVLGPAGLEVEFAFPAAVPAQRLPVLLRRNLYLIYKESLHNVVKHATGATGVAVSVRLEPGSQAQLVLEIVDNGVSGDAAPVRRTGHGLRNIGARAQALGGAATSGGGAGGFRVCVVVPLPSGWKAFGRSNPDA
ncbi:histidine kinase [Hymenobacter terricola]|uniref:histidine kinase n=1 Tax=Hymenobacter terricola TaxID=2819236 RepID=UPI001B3159BC|nr:histidine kinase [Hymenobacter terricola]